MANLLVLLLKLLKKKALSSLCLLHYLFVFTLEILKIILPKEPNASLFLATALRSGEFGGKAKGEHCGLLWPPDK